MFTSSKIIARHIFISYSRIKYGINHGWFLAINLSSASKRLIHVIINKENSSRDGVLLLFFLRTWRFYIWPEIYYKLHGWHHFSETLPDIYIHVNIETIIFLVKYMTDQSICSHVVNFCTLKNYVFSKWSHGMSWRCYLCQPLHVAVQKSNSFRRRRGVYRCCPLCSDISPWLLSFEYLIL